VDCGNEEFYGKVQVGRGLVGTTGVEEVFVLAVERVLLPDSAFGDGVGLVLREA
jgi:hypothetical protein